MPSKYGSMSCGFANLVQVPYPLTTSSIRQVPQPGYQYVVLHSQSHVWWSGAIAGSVGRPIIISTRSVKTGGPLDHLDVLTAEIELAIVLSTIKVGMRPPGLLDVAMRHSVFPLGSCLTLSTLT